MNKLKTIAVDDEAPALRRLLKMIDENPNLELVASAKSAAGAKIVIETHQPDLLLLDIQLKDATAFDLLSQLDFNSNAQIIFITAYDQYAIKAFEFEAIDYLLKPYSQDRFNDSIRRIIAKSQKTDIHDLVTLLKDLTDNSPKMLCVSEGTKKHFIDKEKLQYIFTEGYYCHFILTDSKKMIRISMKKLESILPQNFVRINKSIIINKNFILESIHHKSSVKVTMFDKNEFYISENYINNF